MKFSNHNSYNRCHICDFSFQAPKSEFFTGLAFDHTQHYANKFSGYPECEYCSDFADYSDIDNAEITEPSIKERQEIESKFLIEDDFDD